MSECRLIDMEAYTRGELRFINAPSRKDPEQLIPEQKGDKCPRCGQYTLIHSEGCEKCPACGYDACQWRDV